MGKKKNDGLALEAANEKSQEEFGRSVRSYENFLFGAVQGMRRFTTDIVKRLRSFDLEVLLIDPIERATYCFKKLFCSFRLRVY